MNEIVELILSQYQIFLLILVRTSGIFIFSPFFSSQNIPNIMKVGLTFGLSLVVSTIVPSSVDLNDSTLFILLFKELMVGIIIGFISYGFFNAFYVMGQVIDMKIGFGMVNVIDPQNRVQVPLMGNFYYTLSFLMMLGANGHHDIINALKDSYSYIPLGGFIFSENTILLLVDVLVKSFEIGLKLSMPIVAIVLLTDVLLGIMSKTIPQMNVFVVGMPLKIIVGLMVLSIGIPVFFTSINGFFDIILNNIYRFLKI